MNAYQSMQTSRITWPISPLQPAHRSAQESALLSRQDRSGLLDVSGKQTGRSVPQGPLLAEVHKHYLLPAGDSVLNYLTDHPATIHILVEAAPRLKQYFGNSTIFGLRTLVDEAGIRTLYVVVVWPEEIDAVRNALGRFDDEWWLAHSRQPSEYIVFTYELV